MRNPFEVLALTEVEALVVVGMGAEVPFVANVADARIAFGEGATDSLRVIFRGVIANDQTPVLVRLSKNRFEGTLKVTCLLYTSDAADE